MFCDPPATTSFKRASAEVANIVLELGVAMLPLTVNVNCTPPELPVAWLGLVMVSISSNRPKPAASLNTSGPVIPVI